MLEISKIINKKKNVIFEKLYFAYKILKHLHTTPYKIGFLKRYKTERFKSFNNNKMG